MLGLGKLRVLESKLDIYEDLSKEMLDKLERAVSSIQETNNRVAVIISVIITSATKYAEISTTSCSDDQAKVLSMGRDEQYRSLPVLCSPFREE